MLIFSHTEGIGDKPILASEFQSLPDHLDEPIVDKLIVHMSAQTAVASFAYAVQFQAAVSQRLRDDMFDTPLILWVKLVF